MENLYRHETAECRVDPYSGLITLSLKGDVEYQTCKALYNKILAALANARPFSASLLIDNRKMNALSGLARQWWEYEFLQDEVPEAVLALSKVALVTPGQTLLLSLTDLHNRTNPNNNRVSVRHFQWRHEALFWIIG